MPKLPQFAIKSAGNVGDFLIEIARLWRLACEFAYWVFIAPWTGKRSLRRHAFVEQLVFTGNQSLLIIFVVAASVGAVIALQSAYQLRQFGAVIYTGALVSVSMARELSPLVSAIVIAGRVGASIAAELGSMKVQEEMDALTTMAIQPVPFLVVPRITAILVMLPCLTLLSIVIGIAGGLAVGTFGLGIDPHLFLSKSLEALVAKDILTGLAKSFVFAFLIGIISTYKGLSVQGGAEGVGRATTESVVWSILSIIVSDCLLTSLFYYAFS
ncbi:MAG: ABC transporter permease [Candidatus Omnitrophica bacterium]|nr:ABC transporter permease [Candidatus Omnitrophota bacterium]